MMVQCHVSRADGWSRHLAPGATTSARIRGIWSRHAHRITHASGARRRRSPGGAPMSDSDRPAPGRLRELLEGFAGRRVLVLGDMVADEYIVGRPVGLSREAPLPVLQWVDRYIVPGGATNVARNVRSLGGEVAVAGVIGRDE